jgi:hypothetical protein
MRNTIAFLIVFLNCLITNGQLISDNGGFLSEPENLKLKTQCEKINKNTSVEILLYTELDLNGQSAKEYGMELSKRIPVGKKGINNGILIVLSKNDRKLQILNGLGLEWILSDEESTIIVDTIVHFFKKKEYFNGLETALNLINEKVSKYDWDFKETEFEKISKNDLGKILKFNYSNTSGKTNYKYGIDLDPQFSEDFKIVLQSEEKKFELYYTKYMNDNIGKILTKKEITIYARLKDWDLKKLELLGIE